MRTIQRQSIPNCLTQQPANRDWYAFMQTPCHSEVHANLWQEQQGLCCYCETEIQDDGGHIEHMEPQSRNQARIYDYDNIALSCNGGVVEHCGHYKDDRAHNPNYAWDSGRFSPPHDPETVMLFFYNPEGKVEPSAGNEDKASYLIGYLGLNCARLTQRRRAHAQTLIDTLGEQPDEEVVAWLRKDHLEADDNGRLQRFYSLSKQILEP